MQANMSGHTRRRLLLAAAALAFACPPLQAQPLSERPIRIIVGAPAGGTADILARLVGDGLSKGLGQPVIVDNKPGALGVIAMDSFLSSPRDGHTYLMSVNGLFSEVPHSLKPKYDPLKDVKPLVEVARSGLVLVGNAALAPRNMAEMVAYVKAHPGKVNSRVVYAGHAVARAGPAAEQGRRAGHAAHRLQGLAAGAAGHHGRAGAVHVRRAGHLDPAYQGGQAARLCRASSPERSPALPDVPTLAELGYKEMTKSAWLALWTLPDAPAAAQQRVREETLKALATPAIRDRLLGLGLNVNTTRPPTPEEMSRSLAADYLSIGEALKAVNYKPE